MKTPQSKEDLLPPYPFTSDVELPPVIVREVNNLLQYAANVHNAGGELTICFVGLTAEGEAHFINCDNVPKPMVAPWVMMRSDEVGFVSLLMCTEGWSLPQEIARDYQKPGGYNGKISEHPEAFEVLMLSVETSLGTWMGQLAFKGRYPDRELLEPEGLRLEKAADVGGKFNNLLKSNRHMKRDLLQVLFEGKQFAEQQMMDGL